MKLKNSFFYTLRQPPKDEESDSAILLTRAGYIKKTSAGDYMFMPLGHKVKRNIENIIREEMDHKNLSCLVFCQKKFMFHQEEEQISVTACFHLKIEAENKWY